MADMSLEAVFHRLIVTMGYNKKEQGKLMGTLRKAMARCEDAQLPPRGNVMMDEFQVWSASGCTYLVLVSEHCTVLRQLELE